MGKAVERIMVGQLLGKETTNWFRGISVLMVLLSHYAEWWIAFAEIENPVALFCCNALTKLGVYGVNVFFLFSGYAMVKSLKNQKVNKEFIWKKVKNVYFPYLIIVGIIELLSGGFRTVRGFLQYLSGYHYWFMMVLFLFYIGFMILWATGAGKGMRILLFCVYSGAFSFALYNHGMLYFFYVSNIAFVMGVAAGEYDRQIKQFVDRTRGIWSIVLAAAMILVVYFGLVALAEGEQITEPIQIWYKIGATVIWTLAVILISSKGNTKGKLMMLVGKCSLYSYLTHTFIFMQCVNFFPFNIYICTVISALITFAVSYVFFRIKSFMTCR